MFVIKNQLFTDRKNKMHLRRIVHSIAVIMISSINLPIRLNSKVLSKKVENTGHSINPVY